MTYYGRVQYGGRKMGNHHYHLYDAYRTKEMAKHYADDARSQGALVRVIEDKATPKGGLKWQLWVYWPKAGYR